MTLRPGALRGRTGAGDREYVGYRFGANDADMAHMTTGGGLSLLGFDRTLVGDSDGGTRTSSPASPDHVDALMINSYALHHEDDDIA